MNPLFYREMGMGGIMRKKRIAMALFGFTSLGGFGVTAVFLAASGEAEEDFQAMGMGEGLEGGGDGLEFHYIDSYRCIER